MSNESKQSGKSSLQTAGPQQPWKLTWTFLPSSVGQKMISGRGNRENKSRCRPKIYNGLWWSIPVESVTKICQTSGCVAVVMLPGGSWLRDFCALFFCRVLWSTSHVREFEVYKIKVRNMIKKMQWNSFPLSSTTPPPNGPIQIPPISNGHCLCFLDSVQNIFKIETQLVANSPRRSRE